MIKIHKVFLKNFKGVRQAKVIDFSGASLIILDGPNGFGKTTIFDAIEICLRAKIERTVSYEHVTKKNADHKKPFYQNIKGEDVLLKLWLRDDVAGTDHIVYKFLPRNHDGKIGTAKAFRPDAWGILSTFYSSQPQDFETKEDVDGLEVVEQSFIDELIFGQNELSLVNLYPLFNYIQQEENIYFLKKDEEKKKNELDFLFQTQQEAHKLEKIEEFLRGVRSCKQDVGARLAALGDISSSSIEIRYKKLFETKSLLFDSEGPFKDVAPQNLSVSYERVRDELEELISFKENFDPEEFEKFKLKESLSIVRDDRTLKTAFVLQLFFQDELYERLKTIKNNIDSYQRWSKKLQENTLTDDDLLLMSFDTEFVNTTRALKERKAILEKQIGELGKIIVELISSREKVMTDFAKVDEISDQEPNCPLCNSQFQSMELLIAAVDGKAELLRSINETQVTALVQLNDEVKRIITEPIAARINVFLEQPENKLDIPTFDLVTRHKDFDEITRRFNAVLLKHNVDLSRFYGSTDSTMEQVDSLLADLNVELARLIDSLSLSEEKLIGRRLFKDFFDEKPELLAGLPMEDLIEKRSYLYHKYMDAKFTSGSVLQQRLESLQVIENRAKGIQEILDKAIKKYKMEMVDKIKIPFYIFSGKMIQNYQQGFGIFIDMNERTNRVRFLTDSHSDHDIIHHLSSGQLAVVSIAFCLALNKVYSTTNNFKFLAIDDPVQTLDDINVHSFIELMRHDFKSYQILISTHEENVAGYMDYKFKKFGFSSERQRVQKLFYESI